MNDYSWIFNAEGKVNKGLKCVYEYECEWGWNEAKVVELAGYRPYYTDGTPDPDNDEVNERCYIEVDGDVNDSQVSLEHLLPITDKSGEYLYNGDEVELVGTAEGEYNNWSIIKDGKELKIVENDDLCEVRHIDDLNEEECKQLAKEVVRGSIYVSDYNNSLGVPSIEVSNYCDDYYNALYEKYEDDDVTDTLQAFAYYLFNGEVA